MNPTRSPLFYLPMLLASCAEMPAKVEKVEVPVPVVQQCPKPDVPAEPVYQAPTGTSEQIIKTLTVDFGMALGDARTVRELLPK